MGRGVHDEERGEDAYEEDEEALAVLEELNEVPDFEAQHHASAQQVEDAHYQQPTLQLHLINL